MWNTALRKIWNEGVYLFSMFLSEREHVPNMIGMMFSERGTYSISFESISLY
jgi:hypothetical protein